MNGDFVIALLGNKNDLVRSSKGVYSDQASKYCKENNIFYAEVSAKTGDGIMNAFIEVGKNIFINS